MPGVKTWVNVKAISLARDLGTMMDGEERV